MKIIKTVSFFILLFFGNLKAQEIIYHSGFDDNAIRGYDIVSYFNDKKAVKGNKKFNTIYKETKWIFSSKANLDLFNEDPEKYLPQYGGFCTYAIGERNELLGSNPKFFSFVDNKLYLHCDENTKRIWETDSDTYIMKAEKNWQKFIESKL
jgi:YHS domain-containing protein